MRDLFLKSLILTDESGTAREYDYYITIDEMPVGDYACESYGLRITRRDGAEEAEVHNITCSISRIDELCELVLSGGVTPLNLQDVVSYWL